MSMDFIKSIYYEFLSYFVPKKIKYKIEGECNQCGKCCKQIRSYGLKNEKEFAIMQKIFPHYKRFFITGKDKNGEYILSCKYLSKDNKCSVYNKRPLVCRNYPRKYVYFNAELIEGCGYRVVKKEFKDYL